ncbi:serine protease 55 [Alligator mississippiensis]|uniref:Serine protease 55 isoform B n=1 Tax=Alligator mississippiensis TaxID=8496 RepID=A0A151MVM8_ALLMI|nr:serine protease 55 [Alligator mississippiensis]KYO28544.1 serine protease 55 isoform B [Alligator mississippiensis]
MLLLTLWLLTSFVSHGHADCGLRPAFKPPVATTMRVIGGRGAQAGEFPWQVSIQSHGRHFCGGMIISSWWILSAAHCFEDEAPPDLTVAVGVVNLKSHQREMKKLDKLIVHEDFNKLTLDNDIALLLLDSPIRLNEHKVPVCLPLIHDLRTWKNCWVAGWGTTVAGDKTKTTTMLQKVEMQLISQKQCAQWISQLTDNMLCAGYEEGGKDACQGDSGGPLVCTYGNIRRWFAVGIVSWGQNCAERHSPGMYTIIINYLFWIQKKTALEGKPFFPEAKGNATSAKILLSGARKCPVPPKSPLLFFIYFVSTILLINIFKS